MRLRRAVTLSVRALFAQRLRAALALASITVGTAAVIVTGAVGSGVRAVLVARVEQLGTRLVVVRPAQVTPTAARPTIRGLVTTLRPDDAAAIGRTDGVELAAPAVERRVRAKRGAVTTVATALGTTRSFVRIRNVALASGRFFDDDEASRGERVAVLGASVARALFGTEAAESQLVSLSGVPFVVTGVLRAKGVSVDGSDQDAQVLVPLRTAQRRLANVAWLNEVFVRVASTADVDAVGHRIAGVLRQRHRGPTDADVQDTSRLLAMQQQTAAAFDRLSSGLAAVSLVLSGSGVGLLLWLSVRERTPEIGLRLAVGARRRDILMQFLGEAGLLAVAGWVVGVAVGATITGGLAWASPWPVAPPLDSAVRSLVATVATGLLCGLWPAAQAARVAPIRALLTR